MPTATERAWAAGFWDGEGHVGLPCEHASKTRARDYCHLTLSVAQVQRAPLLKFKRILGVGHLYGPYKQRKKNHQSYYQFTTHKQLDLKQAVKIVWPWLSASKRKQVTKAFKAFRVYQSRPKLPMGPKPKDTNVK